MAAIFMSNRNIEFKSEFYDKPANFQSKLKTLRSNKSSPWFTLQPKESIFFTEGKCTLAGHHSLQDNTAFRPCNFAGYFFNVF